MPVGQSAVGWRVGVYWPADQAFYCGGIQGFDAAAGRHEVAYDDGEQGPVNLGVDRVKWILPPGAAGGWMRRGGGLECLLLHPPASALEWLPAVWQPEVACPPPLPGSSVCCLTGTSALPQPPALCF